MRFLTKVALFGALSLAAAACGSGRSEFDDSEGDADAGSREDAGPSFEPLADGGESDPQGPAGPIVLTIRDFRPWQAGRSDRSPDFQNPLGIEAPERFQIFEKQDQPTSFRWVEPNDPANSGLSIVLPDLGDDGKPVYNEAAARSTGETFEGQPRTTTTHGKRYFDMWYHDAPPYNVTLTRELTLTDLGNGLSGYDSLVSGVPYSDGSGGGTLGTAKQFFPINGDGFGDTPGQAHNYHFTTELHTVFTYRGGETFTFTGDDDVFVFVNRKIVINMGGVRFRGRQSVALDEVAQRLGLVIGQSYPLDLFSAERRTPESNLRFETSLRLRPAPIR